MRLPFPEQKASFDDSGFVNLEPRDYWAECYGCFNNSAAPSGGGGSNEPRGVKFGVDGRSVTGSTAQDRAIGYTDGDGGKGANFDQMSQASSSQVRAAVDAANRAAAQDRNTISAARAALGGGDDYNIGQAGEFSAAAMAAPTVAPPAVATGSYDDAQNQLGAGPIPEARITKRPKPNRDLMTIFPGVLGRSIFAGSQGRDEPIERSLALTALQDRAVAGDPDAQTELDKLFSEKAVTFPEANYAFLQQQKEIDASRVLNQAPVTTPIQVDDGAGVAAPRPGAGLGSFVTADGQTRTSISPQDRQILADGLGVSDGGYEDDPMYDADIFGTPRYAGGVTGLDGNVQGFKDAAQMGQFVEDATRGGLLGKVTDYGIIPNVISRLTGQTPMDMRRGAVQEFFESGAQYNPESGKMEIAAGPGTLKMGESGVVTYTGMPDPDYTGMYANLVNPPSSAGGESGAVAGQPMFDPCPEGFKLVGGVCQPIEAAEESAAAGSSSQQTPTTNLPTSFTPFTQATPVGTINPFVLRPTPVPGFANGGDVDPYEAELSAQAAAGGSGSFLSGGFDYSNQNMTDDGGTQTVIATPVNTQGDDEPYQITDAQANQMNQQTQLNQAAMDAQNQRQTEAQMRNQQLQANIDRLNQMRQDLNAPSQPGLANTIMQGALDIFASPVTKTDPSAAAVPPTQNLPMNPNMQGQVGDISKQGQIQAPAGLGSITQSADQAVSGINQAQFTNVMPESRGFPSPEEIRSSLGLPQDIPGAVGDFLSGLGKRIAGPTDTFRNAGTIGQSASTRNSGTASRF